MSQGKLPFDKREYRVRMEAIEGLTTAATGLSTGRLKRVQDFLKRVFRHKSSSCEGDITFVASENPKHGQFSLSAEFFVSRRTIQNWVEWSKSTGLIDTAIDCDSWGDRRTTLSLNWATIKQLAGLKLPADQSASVSDQSASVSDQSASVSDQSATDAPLTKPIPNNPKSQQRGRGGTLEIQAAKACLRSLGVGDLRCVDVAIGRGVRIEEIRNVIDSAQRAEVTPKPQVVRGRVLAIVDNPRLAEKPWPEQIAATDRLRKADAAHYAAKRQRGAERRAEQEADARDQQDALEREWGPVLDAMPNSDELELAANVLSEYELKLYRGGNVRMFREEMLQGLAMHSEAVQ